jgi:hypothetical protein
MKRTAEPFKIPPDTHQGTAYQGETISSGM